MQTVKPGFLTKDNILSAMSPLRIELSAQILQKLVGVMNEIHGVNYSDRFWKLLMQDYISSVISKKNIFEEKRIDLKPDIEAINGFEFPTMTQKLRIKLKNNIKHFSTLNNRKSIHSLLSRSDNLTLGFPELPIVKADLGEPLPIHYPIFNGKGNEAKRENALAIAEKEPDIFFKNIVLLIPKLYVEFFDKLFNDIPLLAPEKKAFHVHVLFSAYHKMLIAKYVEHGAKLYWYQHGAFYGEFIGHNGHFNESSVADEFRTWGWKIKGNDVPWKAYRLEKFRIEYERQHDKNIYDCLMCFSILYSGNLEFYTSVTNYFLENIDNQKYHKFLARPRPKHKMYSQASQLKFITDKRIVKDSGLSNMAAAIAKCKIIIQFSVPATNFLECLYVNHPTVCLLRNDQPTDIVKPFYDFFLKVGVLHEDFESLIRHLNNIDIDEWWSMVIAAPEYQEFKSKFLRAV